jgi:pimeloyl-ACP methyl ester carboxylesterase
VKIAFKNPLFDGQLLRALSHVYYGGADVGECLAVAARIPDGDTERWYREWMAIGERLYAVGEHSRAAGANASAREAFLRSSNYFRTAGIVLLGAPVDPRFVTSYDRQRDAFHQAIALFETPVETVSIPFEGHALPGYFFAVDDSGKPRPTLILTGGYDSTTEELYFFSVAAALRRGYNCLCYDGPGQGGALLHEGLTSRPDWELVITPGMDYALTRFDVDARHVALIGLSLGGYLALRAATGEHRLAACIADPGQYDLLDAIRSRLPLSPKMRAKFPDVPPLVLLPLLAAMKRQPFLAWTLRRAMLVHGVQTPQGYLKAVADYTLVGRIGAITCPTLICDAADDTISAFARQTYDMLQCPKSYQRFTSEEGAGEHCEMGARSLFHQRAFDWLDALFVTPAVETDGVNGALASGAGVR